jgi:hypothetical protein
MDLHQLRMALLKLSVPVLIGSTWVFASFIMASRPDEATAPGSVSLSSLVRLPASLPARLPEQLPAVFATSAGKAPEPVRMDVVKLDCWDMRASNPRREAAQWVRLTGKPCQSDVPAAAVSVKNLSNGYAATVFEDGHGRLTTDFIPLQKGRNSILIRFRQGRDLQFENSFLFER